MTPADLLARLRSEGFSVRADAGRLLVKPASKLPADLKAALSARRAELVALLELDASRTPDEVVDALAVRAADDEPDWVNGVCLRETVIVRADGWPVMAFSPEFVEAWEAWNRAAQERHDKAQAAAPAQPARRKPSQRRMAADDTGSTL